MTSNSNSNSNGVVGRNPLEDAEIKQMLIDAKSKIGTKHDFHEWQASFLKKFTIFLDTDGSDKAQKAYATFRKASKSLIKIVKQLQAHIDAGTISETRISVKGRNSMSELKVVLDKLVDGLQQILPTTNTEIQAFGFSKFHMAAVLVKDGFKEYAVMEYCRLLLKLLRVAALDRAAGSTILHQVDVFGNQFDVFCGVMASLHILDLANLTSALLHADLHKESQKIQSETIKLKEEKNLAASSHDQRGGGGGGRSRSMKSREPPKQVASFGEEDEVSSYETIGYEDVESISSYESIEEIETVSSYETVVKDEESSYETIEIDVPSDYEEVQEEILVSDYESDNGTDDGTNDGSRPVTDDDDDNDHVANNNDKSSAKNKKKSLTRQKKEADAKKKEAAAARARKKLKDEEPKIKPVPKQLPVDPRFANVEKEWKKEQEARKRNKGKNQNNNKNKKKDQGDDDKGDSGKKQKDEEEEETSDNPDDAEKDADEGNGAGGKAPDGKKAVANEKTRSSMNEKPKAPPDPDANTKPVQRIQWTPKDYYHGQNQNNNDCFNEWKKYKKEPGTTSRAAKSTSDDDDDDESSSKVSAASTNKTAATVEKQIIVPASRPKKRVVHTEIVTTRKKVSEAHKERIRRKKEKTHPPQVIRIRHTKQIVKKVRVKKNKPKPVPKKIRVKKEKNKQ